MNTTIIVALVLIVAMAAGVFGLGEWGIEKIADAWASVGLGAAGESLEIKSYTANPETNHFSVTAVYENKEDSHVDVAIRLLNDENNAVAEAPVNGGNVGTEVGPGKTVEITITSGDSNPWSKTDWGEHGDLRDIGCSFTIALLSEGNVLADEGPSKALDHDEAPQGAGC